MTKKPLLVREIMTRKVMTLYPEENLDKIEEAMDRFRFRHVPVIDQGKLVGLVTHRDLLRASASALEHGAEQRTKTIRERTFVQTIMQRDVVTAREDMPLIDAARLMLDQKLGCLPVTQADGTLVGIVTQSDFLRLSIELLT